MMFGRILFFRCLLICMVSSNTGLIYADLLQIHCPNDTSYDSNSTSGSAYTRTLNFLLSTLSSNASLPTRNGFYNFTAGQDTSNMVYGLFLCRGDVSPDACGQCVAGAADKILKACANIKAANIWYDECLLRYSNESIFSREDVVVYTTYSNPNNATEPEKFHQVLDTMMRKIESQAANGGSAKKFAVQEAEYSQFQKKIYALGQCTPDLSSSQCDDCLADVISKIPKWCANREGCRILVASCNIRFEASRFYNAISPAPEPSSPTLGPPPPPFFQYHKY